MQVLAARIDHAAFQQSDLVLITPEPANASLHAQLIELEAVHAMRDMDDLLENRLGWEDSSKRCFALVREGEVLAAIYTHATHDRDPHKRREERLPGNVERILKTPSEIMAASPDVIAFYSISSPKQYQGAGQLLIRTLHAEFKKAADCPILTTLSPLRGFAYWAGEKYGPDPSPAHRMVAEYLATRTNQVQRFHQKNGAEIGAIHFNANAPGTPDRTDGLGIMISYDYSGDAGQLAENRRSFSEGGPLPVAGYLKPVFA